MLRNEKWDEIEATDLNVVTHHLAKKLTNLITEATTTELELLKKYNELKHWISLGDDGFGLGFLIDRPTTCYLLVQ